MTGEKLAKYKRLVAETDATPAAHSTDAPPPGTDKVAVLRAAGDA